MKRVCETPESQQSNQEASVFAVPELLDQILGWLGIGPGLDTTALWLRCVCWRFYRRATGRITECYASAVSDACLLSLSCLKSLTIEYAVHCTTLLAMTGLTALTLQPDADTYFTGDQLGVGNLTWLQKLTLVGDYYLCQATQLSRISGMTNLHALYLYDSSCIEDEALSGVTHLTALGLCGQSHIREETLAGFTGLTELRLNRNWVITDDTLTRLTNLRSLNLCENHVITDKGLSVLTGLQTLCLRANDMISGSALSTLTALTDLNMTLNHHIDAEALLPLRQVKRLDIRHSSKLKDAVFPGLDASSVDIIRGDVHYAGDWD